MKREDRGALCRGSLALQCRRGPGIIRCALVAGASGSGRHL